jgi:hypothetical protein
VNIWKVNGANVQEIALNVPTGSTLALKDGSPSQSAPALSDPALLIGGPANLGTNHNLVGS